MKLEISAPIKCVNNDIIEILGVKYYKENYVQHQIRIAKESGVQEGRKIHCLEIKHGYFEE